MQAPMKRPTTIVSIESFEYTPPGIQRLCKVAQATLKHRGWSGRDLARAVQARLKEINQQRIDQGLHELKFKASHGAIARYINGTVREPNDDVISAIAPFMFRVISIEREHIHLDVSRTYDDWREFARIGTADYVESANLPMHSVVAKPKNLGSRKSRKPMTENRGAGAVGRLIRSEMIGKGLDPLNESDFRDFARFFPSVEDEDISYVRDVVQGHIPYVDDDYLAGIAFALLGFTGDGQYTTEYVAAINSNHDHEFCEHPN